MPKTGGISVGAFLRSMYSPDEICPAIREEEFVALDQRSLAHYRYFGGHFSLDPLTLLPEPPAVVTVVRNPLTHLRSHYEHARGIEAATRPDLWNISFTEWLRHEETRPLNENLQARYLAGSVNRVEMYDDDELFERAVATLDGCLWHSATERLGASIGVLAAALRWPPPRTLRPSNVNPDQPRAPTVEEQELIHLRCPVDARLHRHVLSRTSRPRVPGAREFDRTLSRASWVLERPLVVDLNEPFWGSGWVPPIAWWHGDRTYQASLASLGDRAARWVAIDEPATIDLPVRLRPGDRIDAFIANTATAPPSLEGLQIEVNGYAAPRLDGYYSPPHLVLSFGVAECRGRFTRLTFRTPGSTESSACLAPPAEGRVIALERVLLVPRGATLSPTGSSL